MCWLCCFTLSLSLCLSRCLSARTVGRLLCIRSPADTPRSVASTRWRPHPLQHAACPGAVGQGAGSLSGWRASAIAVPQPPWERPEAPPGRGPPGCPYVRNPRLGRDPSTPRRGADAEAQAPLLTAKHTHLGGHTAICRQGKQRQVCRDRFGRHNGRVFRASTVLVSADSAALLEGSREGACPRGSRRVGNPAGLFFF